VNVAQPGFVDPDGNNTIHQSGTVTGGSTNSFVFSYDRAATISATFQTMVSGVLQADKATDIMVANSALQSPGTRTFSVGSAASTISTGASLYPFNDGYVAWAGNCSGADPRSMTVPQPAPLVTVTPAGTASVVIREPALNILVKRGTAAAPTAYGGATVRITPMTAGCGATFGGANLLNTTGAATGTLINPGMPYGDYQVCVSDGSRKVVSSTIQDRVATGTAVQTLTIVNSGSGLSPTGTCP